MSQDFTTLWFRSHKFEIHGTCLFDSQGIFLPLELAANILKFNYQKILKSQGVWGGGESDLWLFVGKKKKKGKTEDLL